jgi:CubicO group peptidase (beta-lactamase class C family)
MLTACGGSGGGGDDEASLRAELESIRSLHGLPALAAMRVEGDAVAEMAAVGSRAAGSPGKVTTRDQWHLGSLTKAMTATLAARLVERSLITWDTTIKNVFPALPGMLSAYDNVRLDELLSHRSGLSDDIKTAAFLAASNSADPLDTQRRDWIEILLAEAPAVSRGSYLYSNGGYIVAGAMLEAKSGKTWEDLLDEELLTPLGMTNTGFGPPGTAGMADQPRGHRDQAGTWVPLEPDEPGADNPPALGPAGTVHSTLADYARFVAAHLDDGTSGYLSAASLDKLHSAAPGTDAALGWFLLDRPWAGGRVLQHAGSNTLWYAVIWVAPKRDFAVFAVTNAAGTRAEAATDTAAGLLIDRHYD